MASKHKKAAAACARVGRAAARQKNLPFRPSSPEPFPKIDSDSTSWFSPDPEPIKILMDSESDCGYTGGVNYHDFDSDSDGYEPGTDEDWSDSNDSLVEFEGDELENNLWELQEELDALATPSKYDLITGAKTNQEWKGAEKKRRLGYTKQCHAKAAQEREIIWKKAKDLCVHSYSCQCGLYWIYCISEDPQVVMMWNMFAPKPMPKQTMITTSEDLPPLKNVPAAQKCFASTMMRMALMLIKVISSLSLTKIMISVCKPDQTVTTYLLCHHGNIIIWMSSIALNISWNSRSKCWNGAKLLLPLISCWVWRK
jgi:hypothetical protein